MQKNNQRIMRTIVGALLSSGISEAELREFARAIRRNQQVGEELAGRLLASLGKSHRHSNERYGGGASGFLDQMLAAVKRKRLRKETVVKLLDSICGDYQFQRFLTSRSTVLEIITSFEQVASAEQQQYALSAIKGDTDDPYLEQLLKL